MFENTLLITHANCPDGSVSALLFMKAGGRRQNIRFVSPNQNDVGYVLRDALETWAGPILLVDVSVAYDFAKDVSRSDVLLLDHHKSALQLKDISWCEIDVNNSRCGSMMLYDFIVRSIGNIAHKYKELVEQVDDIDRWKKSIPGSMEQSNFHFIVGQQSYIDRFLDNPQPIFDEKERYLLSVDAAKKKTTIEEKKKNALILEKDICGKRVRVAYVACNSYFSELGASLCEDPDLDIDIAVMFGGGAVSLRARNSCPVDLSEFTKLNGGGGHKCAAGFSSDVLFGKTLVEYVADRIKYE